MKGSDQADGPVKNGDEKPTVVGIGASAGGLAALKTFFANVPEKTGLTFVVVMHLSPDHESQLADLLQAYCKIPVRQVNETVVLEADQVYVIPPGRNLNSVDTHLRLSDLEEARRDRAAIDHFFRTLASTHDGRSVGVILTGTGSDGTLGIKEIKGRNGLTIVQDPNEAEFDGMPQSALSTGLIDRVLPVAEIPDEIMRYARTQPRVVVPDDESDDFDEAQLQLQQQIFTQIRARTGRDFSRYKHSTVMRRIRRRMQLNHVEELGPYLELLREQPDEVRALADEFLINVTNFFRDREVFEGLENDVIPKLFEGKGPEDQIRVWTVGCATGEEAYSLAILLMEQAARVDNPPGLQVFASDLHEPSLRMGREGLYSGDIQIDVSDERIRRFFTLEDGGFRVRKDVRELVVFASHNLMGDPPFSRLDLITCRNVLIYLQRDVQQDVIQVFHYALNPSGYLILGASETTSRSDLFHIEDKQHCVYRKRDVPTHALKLPVFPRTGGRPGQAKNQSVADTKPLATYGALHQKIVERYAPPSLLLNAAGMVVHFSENVGRFLVHPGGEPTFSVFKLVREELRLELRAALATANQRGRPVRSQPIRIRLDGERRQVIMHVRPAEEQEDQGQQGLALVIFEERTESRVEAAGRATGDASSTAELEAELELNKQRLQTVIEDYESGQEDMRAANEELQSANEELRSTMEELETSKEELQSMNEELTTVSQENRDKVEELSQLSNDLQNLLSATGIATIFLDPELHILRFTPQVGRLFNIRVADIGRPLSDLTHRLGYDQLIGDSQEVLARLEPIDREVEDIEGNWYLTRVRPYRSTSDQIAGVVITFVDITERKRFEEELSEAHRALEVEVKERIRLDSELASKLTMAEQEERRRVSQVLHDDLQQLLYGLQIKQLLVQKKLSEAGHQQLTELVAGTLLWIRQAIETTRQLTVDLSPPILKSEGLAEALEWLQRQMLELHELTVDLTIQHPPHTPDKDLRVLLFQIVRELLFNVKKHSDVHRAHIELDQTNTHILIRVSDTGSGFDLPMVEAEQQTHPGFGLVTSRERLRLMGGCMQIETTPGVGTSILIKVPARPEWLQEAHGTSTAKT
ncbi:PAS domain-containing protein [Halomonas sp. ANAO-440]|uniref:chemotaxis protein CheB n=1 Tax=Halomonas sp. ANAO-440 TaxID=2861360 RepID=UPI001CAA62B3|nr:chemotaxis protein CheB [Halomonas sp. ANAO-440]MBZ0328921.1 PAS domain-containing protein [Halomonas sp. ANAO-440]